MATKDAALIELAIKQFRSHTLGLGTVHLERLLVGMQIGTLPPFFAQESIVDTGAFLSIFPERFWRQFVQEIHWPTTQEEAALPKWCTTVSGLAGGKCPCRLDRVAVELYDPKRTNKRIGPTNLLALFPFDNGSMQSPILGLNGGSFDGRRLILAKYRGRAYLCDVKP